MVAVVVAVAALQMVAEDEAVLGTTDAWSAQGWGESEAAQARPLVVAG